MLSHCLKCRKHAESESPIVVKTKKKKKGRRMLPSKCVLCECKKSRFIKEQEASGLISSLLGVKKLLMDFL